MNGMVLVPDGRPRVEPSLMDKDEDVEINRVDIVQGKSLQTGRG
jgi:hypothetical protein